jgi:hypothetical protein
MSVESRCTPLLGRVLLSVLLPMLAACGGDGGGTSPEGETQVSLELAGLQTLPGGVNYQAWLVMGTRETFWGYPVVLFDVDGEGHPVDPVADTLLAGPFYAGVPASDALGVAISLEPSDTLRYYSSYTFVMGGDLAQGSAQLSPDHWIALDHDFSTAAGRFVLTTPTDENPEDELGGVWFMDPTDPPTVAGLGIPAAPQGWSYEGWVVLGDQTLSTGKFVMPSGADSSATFSGEVTPPAFPGEDFLSNAPAGLTFPPDLSGAQVFVTLEPRAELDTDREAAFFLRILEGTIPADASPLTLYEMTFPAEGSPSGSAMVESTDGSGA